ncbi:MAG TPA: MmgE/PrpD family protein [Baekduia sp.]|jgi:2-methylcitrate dehydratase PrpD
MKTAELAEHVATFTASPADREAARASLLDTLCAAELGGQSPLAARLEALAPGPAFRRAALARADGFDDWMDYGAAGGPVWGALLALGTDDVDAVLEAGCAGMSGALMAWRGYREPDRGFDGTGVFGTLAGALASARLLGLPPAAIAGAIGIAASEAGGVLANLGTDMDALHAGAAARAGELAARLAARGYRGSREILEGRQGFDEAFFGLRDDVVPAAPALATALRIKHVPGHSGHQRPVLALQRLLGPDVETVVVEGVAATSGAVRFDVPRTAEEARASLRFALACVLDHGTVTPADHAGLEAPLARTRVDLRSRWPAEPADGGRVTVHLREGGTRSLALDSVPASHPFEAVAAKWAPYASIGEIGALLTTIQSESFVLR